MPVPTVADSAVCLSTSPGFLPVAGVDVREQTPRTHVTDVAPKWKARFAGMAVSVLVHMIFAICLWQLTKPVSSPPSASTSETSRITVEWIARHEEPPPMPVPPMPIAPQRPLPKAVTPSQPVPTPPPPVELEEVAMPIPVAAVVSPPLPTAEPLSEAAVETASTTDAAPVDPARARRERDDYLRALMAWLARHRSYPDAAKKDKAQGVVSVRFSIDRAGNVLSAKVSGSSGRGVLDQAALDVLQRATPLPAIPGSMRMRTLTITLPIEFSLITD